MAELTTLARPYAKAVFEFAVERNSLDGWSTMLGVMAEAVSDPAMAPVLRSPSLAADTQAQVVIDVCRERINDKASNLVRMLAENKRLALLPAIQARFEALKAEHQNTVDVDVVSAYPLDEAATARLTESLKRRLGQAVSVNTHVDDRLIGGVIIRAGDTVIDGSLRGRLDKLAEFLNA